MNQANILKLLKSSPIKRMYPPQYYRYLQRKMPTHKWDKEKILKLRRGTCVGGYTDKNGKTYQIVIETIYIKPYTMGYSNHKDRRKGREIFISNFPMPRRKLHFK